MAATKEDIRGWVTDAEPGSTHVIVVCDTYDHEDYPVDVSKDQNIFDRIDYYKNCSMQRVMEVYNLNMDIEEQLAEHRAWHP